MKFPIKNDFHSSFHKSDLFGRDKQKKETDMPSSCVSRFHKLDLLGLGRNISNLNLLGRDKKKEETHWLTREALTTSEAAELVRLSHPLGPDPSVQSRTKSICYVMLDNAGRFRKLSQNYFIQSKNSCLMKSLLRPLWPSCSKRTSANLTSSLERSCSSRSKPPAKNTRMAMSPNKGFIRMVQMKRRLSVWNARMPQEPARNSTRTFEASILSYKTRFCNLEMLFGFETIKSITT